ncbi:hypothetical protein ACFRAR_38065 [Kitasatospora sp. NPDC056651]|uniref:hypothetical protein n=1 Tax=unclassified Kitasatospora TaxID=2633591 RepID=UPI003680D786
MRALKRVVAVGALTVPLVIGCAGLASAAAPEGLDANFGQGQFIVNENGAGFQVADSHVGSDGVSHTGYWIWADDTGVYGAYTGAGATMTG